MYFLDFWDDITLSAIGALRSFLLSLCDVVYRLIIFCFNVFEKIGNARLLENDAVNMLYEKVGLVLGIYMMFRLTFIGIQYILNPDAMNDKQKGIGKLLTKLLIVIVLLGTTPFIFNLAYHFQESVAKENIIGKVFVGKNFETDNFGGELSWYLFSTFYRETSEKIDEDDRCVELTSHLIENDFKNNSSLKYTYNCINKRSSYNDIENGNSYIYVIDFDGFVALLAGIGCLWLIVIYTIKVGVRLVQLAFLQLIAPLPIMMYLEPKEDGPFQKWVKLCISTYLDYFIRIAIIYFVCYLINSIMSSENSYFFQTLGSAESVEYKYIIVIMIFALLTFAKKMPELLKEILPNGGSKIGFGASMKDIVGLGKTSKFGAGILGGAIGGTAMGLLSGRPGGMVGGLLRGSLGGLRGQGFSKSLTGAWGGQKKANEAMAKLRANGGNWWGYQLARTQQAFGLRTAGDRFDLEKSNLERENSAYKSFDSYIDAAEKRAEAQILKGAFNGNAHAQAAMKHKNLAEIYRQQSASVSRSKFVKGARGDQQYQAELEKYAKLASDADSLYLTEMKDAKKDFISGVLDGSVEDAPTLQNMQQAAGVIDAYSGSGYDAFTGITGSGLLSGNYKSFDDVNVEAKRIQAENNNRLAENQTRGAAARANSGR